MTCSCKSVFLVTFPAIIVISIIFGFTGLIFVPKYIYHMVKQQTYLGRDGNGTDNIVLKMFRDPPYDVKLQVWTISVQNSDEVINRGVRPVVVEKGPYTFNVILHKTGVRFAANETRLFFYNNKTYFFNRSQSCGNCDLTDSVIVPNIIFQFVVDAAMKMNRYIRAILETFIKGKESVFVNRTVDELLFKGYEDKLIKEFCNNFVIRKLHICKMLNIPDRIGLFYGQNKTSDGIYEVDTGIRDVNLVDKVYSWNSNEGILKNNTWYGEEARMINGTDAELFAPILYNRQNLQIFIGQLCRSFDLVKRDTAITSDIPIFRYGQSDTFLDANVQRSQGFCNPNTPIYFTNKSIQEPGCAPSGLLDMSSCLPGKPRIFWSNAHFRNAPEGVHFDGMASPTENDISFFDVEPITGVIVGVQQRSQLNLGMLRGNLKMTENMSNLIMPMIWINESARIDDHTKNQLKLPIEAMYYSFVGGLGLLTAAALFTVIFVGILIGLKIANNNQRELETEPDEANAYTPLVTAEQPAPTMEYQQQMVPPNQQSHQMPLPNADSPSTAPYN